MSPGEMTPDALHRQRRQPTKQARHVCQQERPHSSYLPIKVTQTNLPFLITISIHHAMLSLASPYVLQCRAHPSYHALANGAMASHKQIKRCV